MKSKTKTPIAIIMGSRNDDRVMKKAGLLLKKFGVGFQKRIVSAHRTPLEMVEFAKNAHENFQVIIAGAGGAAHLPGMVASMTTLPVIGVPIEATRLKGLDALLSIAQMPKGIPVAAVAVDNSENAALLALRILALQDPELGQKLMKFQNQQRLKVKSQRLKR
jgi:5-(carboxyamino)imidazole ribonucleotide mutase